jgi:hypothetical protein
MLESHLVCSPIGEDTPSLNTSFVPSPTVHIEVLSSGAIKLESPDAFFSIAAGAPIEAPFTSARDSELNNRQLFGEPEGQFIFEIGTRQAQPDISTQTPSPAGIVSLLAMAGVVLWRRMETVWHRRSTETFHPI